MIEAFVKVKSAIAHTMEILVIMTVMMENRKTGTTQWIEGTAVLYIRSSVGNHLPLAIAAIVYSPAYIHYRTQLFAWVPIVCLGHR